MAKQLFIYCFISLICPTYIAYRHPFDKTRNMTGLTVNLNRFTHINNKEENNFAQISFDHISDSKELPDVSKYLHDNSSIYKLKSLTYRTNNNAKEMIQRVERDLNFAKQKFIYDEGKRGTQADFLLTSIYPWKHTLFDSKYDNINIANEILQNGEEESGFDLTNEEIKKFKLWTKGNIPYYIDVRSYSDKVLRDRIRAFLNDVNSMTSLNFMEIPSPPKDDFTRWVFFVNRRGLLGCADHSIKDFSNEGVQQVVLGYDCLIAGKELPQAVLAIAGVPPQHNAPNRDEFIKINEHNIMPEKKYLFEKVKDNEWLFHDVDYDFYSAGHYHNHKYSLNGRATIEEQEYLKVAFGETKRFSITDVWKIRVLYNYISRKMEDKVSECKKLFVPGIHFKKYRLSKKVIKPRKKPNKYLGLPEKYVSGVRSEKENVEIHKAHIIDSDETTITMRPTSAQLLKKRKTPKNDPIFDLSDYNTEDENYKKKKITKLVAAQHMKLTKVDEPSLTINYKNNV